MSKSRPTLCPECRAGRLCPFAGTPMACPKAERGAWAFEGGPRVQAPKASAADRTPPMFPGDKTLAQPDTDAGKGSDAPVSTGLATRAGQHQPLPLGGASQASAAEGGADGARTKTKRPRLMFCWVCSRRLHGRSHRVAVVDGREVIVHADCARTESLTIKPGAHLEPESTT